MIRQNSIFEMLCGYTLLLLLLSTNFCYSEDLDDTKLKRAAGGNIGGLFAFPRVGRSDPELTDWDSLSYNSFDDYDLGRHEIKRQGLVPFPRVGRSNYRSSGLWIPNSYNKRTQNSGATNSMWFGPRLGRTQKRNVDSGSEIFTPRLGKEILPINLFDEREISPTVLARMFAKLKSQLDELSIHDTDKLPLN